MTRAVGSRRLRLILLVELPGSVAKHAPTEPFLLQLCAKLP